MRNKGLTYRELLAVGTEKLGNHDFDYDGFLSFISRMNDVVIPDQTIRKVLLGLSYCQTRGCFEECPYFHKLLCSDELMKDCYILLKTMYCREDEI